MGRNQLMLTAGSVHGLAHQLHKPRKPQQPNHNCTRRIAPCCLSTAYLLRDIAVFHSSQPVRPRAPCRCGRRCSRSRCLRRPPRRMESAIERKPLHLKVVGKVEVVSEEEDRF